MSQKTLKILYAIQATGNGHIARAIELYPYIRKFGTVDFFLSGSNASLSPELPIKFRSRGLSLFYRNNGKLNYLKIISQSNPIQIIKQARKLPVHEYDLIINDFEFICSLSCFLKRKSFFHLGHQASFFSQNSPRPAKKSTLAEWVLRNYCRSKHNIGFHFKSYDSWIFPPIIKKQLWEHNSTNKSSEFQSESHDYSYELFTSNLPESVNADIQKKITLYLPQYSPEEIRRYIYGIHNVKFEIFHSRITNQHTEGSIHWEPIDNYNFTRSLAECDGVICGAGFETPAEALFLEKDILVIPINGQYEQYCNAEALKELGVTVVERLDLNFYDAFNRWMKNPRNKNLKPKFKPTEGIIDQIFKDQILPKLELKNR
jgi:uncharacterized protein (TIGR00661 family)